MPTQLPNFNIPFRFFGKLDIKWEVIGSLGINIPLDDKYDDYFKKFNFYSRINVEGSILWITIRIFYFQFTLFHVLQVFVDKNEMFYFCVF